MVGADKVGDIMQPHCAECGVEMPGSHIHRKYCSPRRQGPSTARGRPSADPDHLWRAGAGSCRAPAVLKPRGNRDFPPAGGRNPARGREAGCASARQQIRECRRGDAHLPRKLGFFDLPGCQICFQFFHVDLLAQCEQGSQGECSRAATLLAQRDCRKKFAIRDFSLAIPFASCE